MPFLSDFIVLVVTVAVQAVVGLWPITPQALSEPAVVVAPLEAGPCSALECPEE